MHLFKNLAKNPKFWIVLCVDVVLLALSHLLANAIRFELTLSNQLLRQSLALLPLLLLVKIPSFYIFGLYRGMWRYTSLNDIINILIVSLFSSSMLISMLLIGNRFAGFSRSVFILDCLFTFCFITWHRVAIRYFYQRYGNGDGLFTPNLPAEKKRLLLIGSGDAAEKVLREINENILLPYQPVGLVDDDPKKIGMKLHGVPVIGCVDDLKNHVLRSGAQEILIATVAGNREQMRRFVTLCQQTLLPFKVLPNMGELINGKVSIKSIRDISYKDLLGRDEVRLDQDKIGGYLTGKTVLITGAGGSIGSELCRQSLRFSPGLIILFDSSEENLYNVQMELRHEYENIKTLAVLGKVQDLRLLDSVFRQHRPSVVFHTAAYKHVPLVERNPWQAVYNNIFATQLLMEASIMHGVDRFVLVSTDKAVRPTNVMGASKRVTELLMLAYSRHCWDGTFSPAWSRAQRDADACAQEPSPMPTAHRTRFMGVRFGNVLGSSGSVIPLFKRQIEKGGPVTVTHPDVTRYFMSAEEAAQLILQSGSMGEGGEIFILKMGDPIKIDQMARELIRLTGREPDREIEIRYVGLRAGEKLYEELITEGEGIVDTHHEKIMVLRGAETIACTMLGDQLERLAQKSQSLDNNGIKETLHQIVPEYTPDYAIA
ncbi:nucleoside-diphosphate sugar epimerase/dehydratase [Desulfobulbus sp.]|uniref:polysaccharide biosynthesis protein n=1 Tax=Desulfobulbus sp. TaxID=895 RepID=UPI0027B88451|nr:nucleoside-diphosphate sugar epimerase/dehydratase [Desulfobulbus sp.]